MLLRQITAQNLAQLNRESLKNQREYFKKLLARVRTEDPLYAVLVSVMAETARAELRRDGKISPEDIYQLILDTGMFTFRIREIAEKENGAPSEAHELHTTLMTDVADTKLSHDEVFKAKDALHTLMQTLSIKKPKKR